MSRNRVSSHVIIVNFCAQLGVEYKSMVKLIRPLLKHYFMGRSEEENIKALVTIDARKEAVRRKFIKMAKNPDDYTETDKTVFAVAVAAPSGMVLQSGYGIIDAGLGRLQSRFSIIKTRGAVQTITCSLHEHVDHHEGQTDGHHGHD